MSKGKSVVCNETQERFKSISAAEKALGIKSGELSKYIKSGEQLDGYTYSYWVEPEITGTISIESSDKDTESFEEPNIINDSDKENVETTEDTVPEIEEVVSDTKYVASNECDGNYEYINNPGIESSENFKYDLASKLRLKDIDCGVIDGELTFFNIRTVFDQNQLYQILVGEGYKGRYKTVVSDSARYLNSI